MKRALFLALLLAGCTSPPTPPSTTQDVTFDAITIDTAQGSFTAIVFCAETPATCAFMRGLIEAGYYDGRAFGRIIPGFVIQEVDRTGGTTDQPLKVAPEFATNVSFSAGAFGIARDADPESGGSEFFVMDHPASTLTGNYTAFAQVLGPDGMDVVHKIARVPAVKTGPASSVAGAPPGSPVSFGVHDRVPVDPVTMTRVTWTTLTLPAADAQRYPLQTSDTARTETNRATLEWGADLRAGAQMDFTWYTWPRDASPEGQVRDPAPPSLDDVVVDIDGPGGHAHLAGGALDVDAQYGEIKFRWNAPGAGIYHVRLASGSGELAVANVTVPT